ncbi:MAG: S41 family peptidase [bacterium]|nr:S41 family peptidase [bacterium]
MFFHRLRWVAGLVLAVCCLSACQSWRDLYLREPVVAYAEPDVFSRQESDFVVDVVRNLDEHYYRPESLDYCKLYNAALEGVRERLKQKGVKWNFRPVKDCHTNYRAGERFQEEFDRAWRIQEKDRSISAHELVFAAADRMLDSLGRSHTRFIYPENASNEDDEYDGLSASHSPPYTSGKRILDGENEWSYVRFREFRNSAYSQFKDLYNDPGIFAEDVDGVILDLRGNPGGLHTVLKKMLSVFLRKGTEAFYTKGKKMNESFTANKEPTTLLPLVVLIDEDSGSAAEIFAAVIQESHRGVIVGRRSMGAVEVAYRLGMPYGAQMSVTIAQVYTASGACLEGVGVKPDFEAHRTEADIIAGKDPCLDKAQEVLRGLQDE